jgi:predicted transcriptional regulator
MQERIKELLAQDYLKKDIAKILGVSHSTVIAHSKGLRSTKKKTPYRCAHCGETDPIKFYGKMRARCKTCHNVLGYQSQCDKIFAYARSRGPIECSICAYNKSFAAMEWHHRNPAEKDPSWNRGWNIERLKIELDKCDLVCANCHREIHYGNGGLTPTRTGT